MATKVQVTFDCADPMRLAAFWVEALGYVLQPPPPGFESGDAFADQIGMPADARDGIAAAVDPDGAGPRLLFLRVPEPKSVKHRVHLDLHVVAPGTPMEERRAALQVRAGELVAQGASEVGSRLRERSAYQRTGVAQSPIAGLNSAGWRSSRLTNEPACLKPAYRG